MTSREADARLRAFLRENKLYGTFKLRKRLEQGDACMTILAIAALERFDAIVIGGPGAERDPLVRSLRTTEQLLGRARCPVVIVPAREPRAVEAPLRRIQIVDEPSTTADAVGGALATAFGGTPERSKAPGEGGPWDAIVFGAAAVETTLLRTPPCPLVVCPAS